MAKLSVIGLGIRCPEQISKNCLRVLSEASQVFLISDHLDKQEWLGQLNSNFYNLMSHYAAGKPRTGTYQEMAEQVLNSLRQGHHTALVSYGHPLVFCDPSRLAIEQAVAAGHILEILPGISSIDCLLADLYVDTQNYGLQLYEGHDLLLHGVQIDSNSSQIIFQLPSLGDNTGGWQPGRFRGFIQALAECLIKVFGEDHEVVLYFASNSVQRPTRADSCRLKELHQVAMISEYTLWVPPLGYQRLTPDLRPKDTTVDLELVGYGTDQDSLTDEIKTLYSGRELFCTHQVPGQLEAQIIHDFKDLPDNHTPKTVIFPAHPCSSGAVEWARQALKAGLSYRIRPAISWEDQVYCDIPLDPAQVGFQSFPSGTKPSQPVNLATLQYLPTQSTSAARFWGPHSHFTPEAKADSLAIYLPGPDPRPLVDPPFQRALYLSAVERLVAFIELYQSRLTLEKRSDAKMWLHANLQLAGKVIREALTGTDLADLAPDGNWSVYLLNHPQHPTAPYLLLRMRCQEALESISTGVSLQPLIEWLEKHL